MAANSSSPERSVQILDNFSTAALLALRARVLQGSDTAYDHFLHDYVGDPYHHESLEVIVEGPAGAQYHYHDPHTTTHGYTLEGTLMTLRHAQGAMPGDRIPRYFVATADLRTDTVTAWRLTDYQRRYEPGNEQRFLSLSERPDISAVRDSSDASSLEGFIERRLAASQPAARVAIQQGVGITFMTREGSTEVLHPVHELVDEVELLSAYYDQSWITFDELAIGA